MIVSGVYCYDCKCFVYSRARHDMNCCLCYTENKNTGVAIDGGQNDYFKITPKKNGVYKFLKTNIDQTEDELHKDWSSQANNFGRIKPFDINREILKTIGGITKDKLEHGVTYIGVCRNSNYARWDSKTEKFYYIRFKFDSVFSESINHPEDDDGHDLFIPFEKAKTFKDISKNNDFIKYHDRASTLFPNIIRK